MIRPNHECQASQTRTTSVALLRDGIAFGGSSLPVLFDAFRDIPVWYTLAYGDHPTERYDENVVLVPSQEPLPGASPHPEGGGPLRRWLGGDFSAEEYLLDADAMRHLRVVQEGGEYRLRPDSAARHLLFLHDDCFGWVQPADPGELQGELLERMLLGVLRLHSFYLGREVEWGETPAHVAAVLRTMTPQEGAGTLRQEVILCSDPEGGTLYVEPDEQGRRRTARQFLKVMPPLLPYLGVVRVRDGRAEWKDGDGKAVPER